jgi:hypothetical protein
MIDDAADQQVERHGLWFWLGLAAGWAVIAYGGWGFVDHVGRPSQTGWWVVGTALAHDALIAPVAVVVGIAITAVVPRWARGPVAGGLAVTAVVLAFSYPLLRHFGRRADNASILPLDYPRNVAIVLAAVWLVVGVSLARRRRERDSP